MSLPDLVGHQETRHRLATAARNGRLAQVLLVTGPVGVGKQHLALWLAQLVLCERGELEPCGQCRACRLVAGLGHPDVHWFVPIPRPKAGDPDKAIDEAAEALAAVMDERRQQPLYTGPDGMASHPMASVRLLQRRASLTAVEGSRRVFIIAEADRLVAQESSPEAANALLKLLEEPPTGAVFILTALDPRRVLPTIRSRTVPVRLQRLSDDEVRSFLRGRSELKLGPAELEERVRLAEGSTGLALAVGDETGAAYRAAEELLQAVLKGVGPALERALRQPAYAARGEFAAMLDALADTLGEAARGALGQPVRRPVPAALSRVGRPEPLLQALDRVAQAREAAAGNVNPQLLLAVLGAELAEVL
jgi:DNA polymerase III subunit delta'